VAKCWLPKNLCRVQVTWASLLTSVQHLPDPLAGFQITKSRGKGDWKKARNRHSGRCHSQILPPLAPGLSSPVRPPSVSSAWCTLPATQMLFVMTDGIGWGLLNTWVPCAHYKKQPSPWQTQPTWSSVHLGEERRTKVQPQLFLWLHTQEQKTPKLQLGLAWQSRATNGLWNQLSRAHWHFLKVK
jgi:hypothetical protein